MSSLRDVDSTGLYQRSVQMRHVNGFATDNSK